MEKTKSEPTRTTTFVITDADLNRCVNRHKYRSRRKFKIARELKNRSQMQNN